MEEQGLASLYAVIPTFYNRGHTEHYSIITREEGRPSPAGDPSRDGSNAFGGGKSTVLAPRISHDHICYVGTLDTHETNHVWDRLF